MSQNANKYSIKTDPNPAKPITDACHYSISELELDFIINYDIKYRMGSTGDGEAE